MFDRPEESHRPARALRGVPGPLGIGVVLAGSVAAAGAFVRPESASPIGQVADTLVVEAAANAFPVVTPEVEEEESPRSSRFSRRRPARVIPSPPVRAPGEPPRIGLQAGHWLAAEVPQELDGIRYNGTEGGGRAEWQVTLEIAGLTAEILRANGYVVDILPTTVPPLYYADAFVSIHADGHDDPTVTGFTVAGPRRDASGRSAELARLVGETYGDATQLRQRSYITRRMTGYYAFNSRRYEHAIHPETVAVILETGFITNPNDRRVILDSQHLSAQGIAEALMRFVPHPAGQDVAAAPR